MSTATRTPDVLRIATWGQAFQRPHWTRQAGKGCAPYELPRSNTVKYFECTILVANRMQRASQKRTAAAPGHRSVASAGDDRGIAGEPVCVSAAGADVLVCRGREDVRVRPARLEAALCDVEPRGTGLAFSRSAGAVRG